MGSVTQFVRPSGNAETRMIPPRAVRNNNPGNIRVGDTPWQGLMAKEAMTSEQAAETEFCVFTTPVFGFRALCEIFHTYYRLDGIRTLGEAITRFAPPGDDNNTAAYIQSVCDYTAWHKDFPFPFYGSPATQATLCKAVSIHECGGWFFTQSDLLAGVAAAR